MIHRLVDERSVPILLLLLNQGPLTGPEICDALGEDDVSRVQKRIRELVKVGYLTSGGRGSAAKGYSLERRAVRRDAQKLIRSIELFI